MLWFENLPDPLLMFRIRVGVEKADRHRSNPESPYPSRNPDSLRRVKPFQNPPIIRDPLLDLKPVSSRDQGRQTLNLEIVEFRPILAPYLQHVSKARGRHEGCLGNVSGQKGVRGKGRSVSNNSNKTRINTLFLQQSSNRTQRYNRWIRRRGQDFDLPEAVLLVCGNEIRKGSTDIDSHSDHIPCNHFLTCLQRDLTHRLLCPRFDRSRSAISNS